MSDVVTPTIRTKEPPMGKAEFDRDMWRLKSLRDKFDNPGLNTFESNEVDELLQKYAIERGKWARRKMFK